MKTTDCLMTIFGATGDLTHRKLIPALYQLYLQSYLPQKFNILAIGRRDKTTNQFRNDLKTSIIKYIKKTLDEKLWTEFEKKIEYMRMDFQNSQEYELLAKKINSQRVKGFYARNSLFYLAVAPEFFGSIVLDLKKAGLIEPCDDSDNSQNFWQRLVIEKPFGKDLKSATELNEVITSVIPEKNIYRIDHYLAKEMIQNITMLRRENAIFEPIWNKKYIDNIQISVLEHEGVGSRAGYYDRTGALKDMIQNHLLQIVAILAMDLPLKTDSWSVHNEKVKLLESLHNQISENVIQPVITGQYESYISENGVEKNSVTETFVALKLTLDNERWQGVPFYLVTGKKMAEKAALVTVEFKKPSTASEIEASPNLLQIGIQPREGIHLKLNTKKPTVIDEMTVAEMEYCQSCQYNFNTPDSYEKLLMDVIIGDSTRFTRWDELVLSWSLTDEIAKYCETHPVLEKYPDYSCGPQGAIKMIRKDKRRWWHLAEGGDAPESYSCKTADFED